MANPVQCDDKSLPISLDIDVTVTKDQVLIEADLSTPIFVSSTGALPQGAGRVRYYSTLSSVATDWTTTSEAYKAATSFFAQSPRSNTMAIGQAFSSPVAGFMITAETGDLAAFTAVTDGSFTIVIDGVSEDIAALDFSTDISLDNVASRIQTALQAVAAGGYTAATVVASNATANQFTITSGTIGDGSTVSVLATTSPAVGTDISGVGFLNGQAGETVIGYTPTTFTNELDLIQEAASCSGKFVYGWVLDVVYRDAQGQLDAAAWAEAQTYEAVLFTVSNNPLSLDAGDTNNNIYTMFNLDYSRTSIQYHDLPAQYPDMSEAALMLSVDYTAANSTINAKFKDLPGISPVAITQTQLTVLEGRRGNVFTLMRGGARTLRQGVQSSNTWYTDERTNVDNFINDLLNNTYNVFLVNGKVPYTTVGQALFYAAEQQICARYVRNGMIADRVVVDATKPSGVSTTPAYQIAFQPLQDVTVGERASRILSGNTITLQLSGAINQLNINVIIQE